MPRHETLYTLLAAGLLCLGLLGAEKFLDPYKIQILNLIAINIILALSLNLIYGFTGMFSLGHAGFMAIGAYVCSLGVLTPAYKDAMWILEPIIWPFSSLELDFFPAVLAGGLCAALAGLLIAIPVLRLGGDYLGIATLGFSEIIRVIITNATPITNGSLGLKGIPKYSTLWWNYGWLIFALYFITTLLRSNTGTALKAIRDDQIAARTMGINAFRQQVLSFSVGAFFAGIGGALTACLISSIDPKMFSFLLTFNILMIAVAGGLGSITGSVIAGILITVMLEWLRIVEEKIDLGFAVLPGIPGMRMVIFSLALMFIILFRREGIMGMREFSWDLWRKIAGNRPSPKPAPEQTEPIFSSWPEEEMPPPRPAETILSLQQAGMRFGGVTAVKDMHLAVEKGCVAGLIGPNGAGKTTIFNLITGFYKPTEGRIFFQGEDITGLAPHLVCKKGIARTFQNIRLFSSLTSLQNVMAGFHVRQKSQWWMPALQLPFYRKEEARQRDEAMTLLHRLGLARIASEPAGSLPYGMQRRLEIARALATNPRFLLLDEPAAGMNPYETQELMGLIRNIRRDFDLTILLIEHDMKVVMGVCSRIWVLEYGSCIARGSPEQIRNDPKVIEAYLGEEYLDYA